MSEHKRFSGVVYAAGRIIGTEALIIVILGLFCLLVGWHSADNIAQAFLIAGVLILAVSCAEIYAGRNEMHCVEHQYVQVTMRVMLDEQLTRRKQGSAQVLIWGVILGGLTMGIGFAVAVLFG